MEGENNEPREASLWRLSCRSLYC